MSTREELTLQAETCLRQGRVDDAIAHYRDLAQLQPVEWGTVKQLADLLERAGQREGAARQFARWADYLFAEGFHAKAAALYKKVLKLDDADEHALWQLGEVSTALKLRADARVAFQRVVDLRQRRGDATGAATARDRLDALEAVTAIPLVPPTLPPAYALPGSPHPLARLVDVPPVPAAASPVHPPSPAVPPPVRMPSSEVDSMVEQVDGGCAPIVLAEGPVAPCTRPDERAWDEVPAAPVPAADPEDLEPATGAIPPVVPDSRGRLSDAMAFDWATLLGRDVDVAAGPASRPAAREPAVAVGPPAVGSAAPVAAAPVPAVSFIDAAMPPRWAPPPAGAWATGVPATPLPLVHPEEAVGESASSVPAPTGSEVRPALVAQPEPGSGPVDVEAGDIGEVDEEVDLTQLLEDLKQWDPELPEPLSKPVSEARAGMSAHAPPPIDPARVDEVLDAAFADLQPKGDGRAIAEQQLAAGRVFLAAGLASEAARAFERASVEPRARFDAAMALADLHRSRGQRREAVGWYEQAVAAPVPDAAVRRPVLYDLAESFEALGEPDRAVGVLLDLLSQVEDYRDARARLDRLLRADAGG